MMIPEDATSVAKYMYRIKSIVGGDYHFVMKVLPQCFCLFVYLSWSYGEVAGTMIFCISRKQLVK